MEIENELAIVYCNFGDEVGVGESWRSGTGNSEEGFVVVGGTRMLL